MICEGRIVAVTGGARGLGREYILEFAKQGAKVVINDLGVARDGTGGGSDAADALVEEIKAAGGQAVANYADVADWEGSGSIVKTALDAFGGLDVIVNNAGFLRDRMFANATVEEWDAVMRVHLRGHFCVANHAVRYWRDQSKAGQKVDARIINTSSGAGLQGSIGQAAYSAAKGGIASLTLVQAAELRRYGITANALAPAARTRMTEEAFGDAMKAPESGFDVNAPANVAPLVAWLGSAESAHVTGKVFEVSGGRICLADGWRDGPEVDKGARWDPAELGPVMADLLAREAPVKKVWGS
ncbi:SDR family oxidoreductase [Zavarzinia sp.]|uniref:SDR family oxidoreductase n=1 Tax=Zavarzinia sp. TaxID=2027920 RepID=UPI0035689C9E